MCEKLSNVILTRNGNHVINGLVITIYTKGIKNRALTKPDQELHTPHLFLLTK